MLRCLNCQKLNPTTHGLRKFCSRSCEGRYYRLQKKKALKRNCVFCGNPIPLEAPRHTKYCSHLCHVHMANRRMHEKLMKKREGRTCKTCGNPIPIERTNGAKFCSDKCGANFGRNKEHLPFPCQRCGTMIVYPRFKYCPPCAREAQIEKMNAYRPSPEKTALRFKTDEYRSLLGSQDTLSMAGMIRLMALAEYFGRDLDEWIKENEHTRMLMEQIEEERDRWTMTQEYQKAVPKYFSYTKKRAGKPNWQGYPDNSEDPLRKHEPKAAPENCQCGLCRHMREVKKRKMADLEKAFSEADEFKKTRHLAAVKAWETRRRNTKGRLKDAK